MTSKLRWGIIGTGAIAKCFAENIGASETGTLAAVGSRSDSSARCVHGRSSMRGRPAAVSGCAMGRTRFDNACRRPMPATKRLRLSKLSTMTPTAPSTALNAPAACVARPTSSSPDSTPPARITYGSTTVNWLNVRWKKFSVRCFLIRRA